MAISIASFGSSAFNTTTTPKTIATTWSADDVVVVGVTIENDLGNASTPTVSGLTFGIEEVLEDVGNQCPTYIWSATAASGGSGNISCATTGGQLFGAAVWVITGGSAGVDATGFASQTEATQNLTVADGSIVCYIFGDWAANATNQTIATGSGTATERLDSVSGTAYAWYVGDWAGTSAGTFAFGVSSYTGLTVTQLAVEVLPSAASSTEEGFRWRNDDGDEDGATWRQSQDVDDTAQLDEQVRLRVLVDSTGDLPSTQYQLEYKEDSQTWYRPIGIGYPGTLPAITSATGTADNTAGTTVAAAYPATVTAGDLLIFVVAKDDDATGITDTTGGLTVIRNGNTGSGTDGVCLFAGWMIAVGNEDGTTRTFTGDSEEWQTYCIRILAGAFDATTPIDSAAALNGATTGEAITAAFTCIRPGGLVIACGAVDVDPMDATFSPSGWTDVADNDAGEVSAWVSTRDAATTAGETIASTTFGINADDANVALAFVVNAPLGTAAVTYYSSSHYADGDATTDQLTPPSGKADTDFDAGVMVEGQALADAVNITTDNYTEIEWPIKAQAPAIVTDVYQFRVTANGTALNTYSVSPDLTVVSGSTDATATPSVVTAVASVHAPTVTASGNVTTTIVTGVAIVNAPTIRADVTVVTTTVTGVAVVDTPTITASGNVTTAIVTGIVVIPTPTITASGNVTATVVDGVVVVNAPSIVTENTTTVNATTVTAAAIVDTPTITASGNVTTTTVTAAAVVDAPVVSVSTSATAAVVTGVAVVDTPTITASGNVTTATVTGVAIVDTPTISASVTVTTATVTGVAIVNAPDISSTVTPTTVTGVVEIFTPDITTADTTTINATTVTGVAVVDAPTITASGNVTTTTVTGLVVVDTPTISLSYTALAATVTALAVVGTPTITASATVTPNTVTGVGSVESPTASASVTITPTTVTGVGVVNAPNISSTVTPTTVTGVVVIPTPSVSTDSSANANAVVVTAVGSVGAPTITATGDASPAVVTAAAQIPTPTIVASVTVTPTEVVATIVIPTPGASSSESPQPPVTEGVIVIPTPTILTTVVITPTTVTATVVIPTPAIVGISVPGTLALELVMATLLLGVVSETLTLSVE